MYGTNKTNDIKSQTVVLPNSFWIEWSYNMELRNVHKHEFQDTSWSPILQKNVTLAGSYGRDPFR